MERCFEYLGCKQKECVAQEEAAGTPCWEHAGTLCVSHGMESIANYLGGKTYACEKCLYLQKVKSGEIR